MADPTDPNLLSKLLEYAWAGVLALGGVVYKGMKSDLETHRKEDRENFIALYNGQDGIKDAISKEFSDLNKTMSGMHIQLLDKINEKADK